MSIDHYANNNNADFHITYYTLTYINYSNIHLFYTITVIKCSKTKNHTHYYCRINKYYFFIAECTTDIATTTKTKI